MFGSKNDDEENHRLGEKMVVVTCFLEGSDVIRAIALVRLGSKDRRRQGVFPWGGRWCRRLREYCRKYDAFIYNILVGGKHYVSIY